MFPKSRYLGLLASLVLLVAPVSAYRPPKPRLTYQQLAAHFQNNELLLRAKAQQILDRDAVRSSRYRMANKLTSWAEVTNRTYQTLLREAAQNAAMAQACQQALLSRGLPSPAPSPFTVTFQDLEKTPKIRAPRRSSCVP